MSDAGKKRTGIVYNVTREEHPVSKFLDIATKTMSHQQIHVFDTEGEMHRQMEEKHYSIIYKYKGLPCWKFVFPVSPICLIIDTQGKLHVWKTCVALDDVHNNSVTYDLKVGKIYEESPMLRKSGLSYYIYRRQDDGKFYVHKDNEDQLLINGTSDVIRIAGYTSSNEVSVSLTASTADFDVEVYVYDKYKIKLKITDYTVTFSSRDIKNVQFIKFSEFKYGGHKKCVLCSGLYSSPSHNTVYQVVSLDKYLDEVKRNEDERCNKLKTASKNRFQRIEFCHGTRIYMEFTLKYKAPDRVKEWGYKNHHHHPNILCSIQSADEYYYYYGTEAYVCTLHDSKKEQTEHWETFNVPGMMEKFVRNIIDGLLSLHVCNKIHGNLKPASVKKCKDSSDNSYIAKLGDLSYKSDSKRDINDFYDLKALCIFAITENPLSPDTKLKNVRDKFEQNLKKNNPELHHLIYTVLTKKTTYEEVSAHPFLFDLDKVFKLFMETDDYLDRIVNKNTDLYKEMNKKSTVYGGPMNTSAIKLFSDVRNSVAHTRSVSNIVRSQRKSNPNLLIELCKVMGAKCTDETINKNYFNW